MDENKRITQYDIAKSLNLSQATIARVVSNGSNVKDKTRQLVLDKIKELNYKPNFLASSLARFSAKTIKIKVLMPSLPWEFYTKISDGMNDAFSEIGNIGWEYSIDFADYDDYIRNLEGIENCYDYLIVFPYNEGVFLKRIKEIVNSETKVIFINDDIKEADTLFFIGADNISSGRIAGEFTGKLLKGKGNVVVISSFEQQSETKERITGFRETILNDFNEIKLNCYYYDIAKENAFDFTSKILNKNDDIDGIYSVDGFVNKVGKALKEMNKQDIVLVGHEYFEDAKELLEKNVIDIIISQDPYSQGYSCIKMLYKYIKDNVVNKNEKYYVDYDIIMKHSIYKSQKKNRLV